MAAKRRRAEHGRCISLSSCESIGSVTVSISVSMASMHENQQAAKSEAKSMAK